jgi:hypothetical protein
VNVTVNGEPEPRGTAFVVAAQQFPRLADVMLDLPVEEAQTSHRAARVLRAWVTRYLASRL